MDPQLKLDGTTYHKSCAKCKDCDCSITLSNFTKCDDYLLCKTHYFKRFHEEGSYVGGDKFEKISNRDSIRMTGGGTAIGVTAPTEAPKSFVPPVPEEPAAKVDVKSLSSAMNMSAKVASANDEGSAKAAVPKKAFKMPGNTLIDC